MPSGKILVVDDEKAVLMGWERALRLRGHTVLTANEAGEALRLCSEHAFDVVVLDFIMPSMSGVELLSRIRRLLPTVRSVIVSGKLDEKVSEEELSASLKQSVEADMFLHKPLANDKLLTAIDTLLEGNASRRDWREVAQQMKDRNNMPVGDARKAARELSSGRKRKPPKS